VDKFALPITKPANFGVTIQEVKELASRLRSCPDTVKSTQRGQSSAQQGCTHPAAPLARVR
jgi:hypothetical protein